MDGALAAVRPVHPRRAMRMFADLLRNRGWRGRRSAALHRQEHEEDGEELGPLADEDPEVRHARESDDEAIVNTNGT